jgi:hypothetical protein
MVKCSEYDISRVVPSIDLDPDPDPELDPFQDSIRKLRLYPMYVKKLVD